MSNGTVAVWAVAVVLLALVLVFVRLKLKSMKLFYPLVACLIIVCLSLPGYVVFSYSAANSSKTILLPEVSDAGTFLKNEFGIDSLEVLVSRGRSCRFVVYSKGDLSEDEKLSIKDYLESELVGGLCAKITDYCGNTFEDSFVPKGDSFTLVIKYGRSTVYSESLNVEC